MSSGLALGHAWRLQKDRAGERESVVLTKPEPALLSRRCRNNTIEQCFVAFVHCLCEYSLTLGVTSNRLGFA